VSRAAGTLSRAAAVTAMKSVLEAHAVTHTKLGAADCLAGDARFAMNELVSTIAMNLYYDCCSGKAQDEFRAKRYDGPGWVVLLREAGYFNSPLYGGVADAKAA